MAVECTGCKKSPPEVTLKHCAKCSTSLYCSRDCQKADWKAHKKVCGKQAGGGGGGGPSHTSAERASAGRLSPPKGLDSGVADPFTRLDKGTWLHDRSEGDVFRLLIDAYRLRIEDTHNFDGEVEEGSIYDGGSNGLRGFQRFLGRVAARPGLLPAWWDDGKRADCEALGATAGGQWHDLACAVEKADIVEHYGDARFPMQLRMFAEAVYGRGPGGVDGTGMRRMMMASEQGLTDDMHTAMLDASGMFGRR
ncbi:hypothetical protein JDV02_001711 [Purpureocillium takamizusanense]|uniref:MYND-type domain-containing protein n=1 Tax=Purpureocillium takamizusanense TaxID=2060973 RepID=A0A9Q8Q9P5_9HYPO|nr:uncharacterized protein JDV02_001711 [Purpureocillium takamizusanense]UNI15148.1 hypothetical protein JDV02_001711 [Purpureocillium takamizusanense]